MLKKPKALLKYYDILLKMMKITGMKFSILLRSLLFIFGLILFADGLILILQNKIHLGTILPFLIGLFFLIYTFNYTKIQNFLAKHLKLQKIWRITWVLFSIWLSSLLAFFIYLHQHTQSSNDVPSIDAIIVLGSGIIQGKPSPTLALRLDTAAQIAKQQPQTWIIVSGGLDYGEVKTEADAMLTYLQEKHQLNAAMILKEDQSTSTELNLKNSQKILTAHKLGLDSKIAIVTSDFHTLRAAAIAQKQGYNNFITVSAETPLATRYNAWLREYFAYLSGWLLNEY